VKDDLVILRAPESRDPGDSRFRGVIEAHFAWERARGVRDLVIYILAILSAPVWLAAVRPQWLPAQVKDLALALWAVSFVGFLMAAASEWKWQRQRAARSRAGSLPDLRAEVAPDSPAPHPRP